MPERDHVELQRIIDETIVRSRWPRPGDGTAPVARSSSATAAAAVLAPAHAAARLPPDRARAWVFADALQGRGDLRGELLALELAASHTSDPRRARLLQAERARLEHGRPPPTVRRSPTLGLRWVGGFIVGAHPEGTPAIRAVMAAEEASTLSRVRLDFCTQDELARLVEEARRHARPIEVLDLKDSRLSTLAPLARLRRLQRLRVGEGFRPEVLAALTGLRALSLRGRVQPSADDVASRPELERLELLSPDPDALDGLADALPRLRWLSASGRPPARAGSERPGSERPGSEHPLGHAPRYCASARRLEFLRLPDAPLTDLDGLDDLPALRELLVVPGQLGMVRALASGLRAPTRLERLALLGGKVGELDALAPLTGLRHLTLSATQAAGLDALADLPDLRSLDLDSGDMRRLGALATLTELEHLGLRKLANVDLGLLARLTRLRTLTLRSAGGRPRNLDAIADLESLRRLSLPTPWLAALTDAGAALRNVEFLELVAAEPPDPALLRRLPRLRRLELTGPDLDAVDRFRAAADCPEVAIVDAPARRDLLDHRDLYDWRASPWPGLS